MKILLGTTNLSKAKRYIELLQGFDIEFITLNDLNITEECNETGNTPKENAMLKAEFYGKYCDYVIAGDSALYIKELPLDDKRQPGLEIRRKQGFYMNDDQMIDYYTDLVKSLGGKVTCYYLDGYAIYANNKTYGFMDKGKVNDVYAFNMVTTVHPKRHIGWPLDSISVDLHSGKYFVEEKRELKLNEEELQLIQEFQNKRRQFFIDALGLKE